MFGTPETSKCVGSRDWPSVYRVEVGRSTMSGRMNKEVWNCTLVLCVLKNDCALLLMWPHSQSVNDLETECMTNFNNKKQHKRHWNTHLGKCIAHVLSRN